MADDLVSNLLKWAGVLDIPSGNFVNEDLREAAARILALEAERDGLKKKVNKLHRRAIHAEALSEKQQKLARIERSAAEAAEARIAELEEALNGLNVTEQELVRIHNMCTGVDGDVKIWSKMLHKLTVFAICARQALTKAPS